MQDIKYDPDYFKQFRTDPNRIWRNHAQAAGTVLPYDRRHNAYIISDEDYDRHKFDRVIVLNDNAFINPSLLGAVTLHESYHIIQAKHPKIYYGRYNWLTGRDDASKFREFDAVLRTLEDRKVGPFRLDSLIIGSKKIELDFLFNEARKSLHWKRLYNNITIDPHTGHKLYNQGTRITVQSLTERYMNIDAEFNRASKFTGLPFDLFTPYHRFPF